MYLLIDESGRLVDPSEELFVIVGVFTKTIVGLDLISRRARQRIPRKGKRKHERYKELKFSYTGDKTRRFVLNEICKLNISIFCYQVFKKCSSIPDCPEQFAHLVARVIDMASLKHNINHVIIDRHFTNKRQIESCNEILQISTRKKIFIKHLNSEDNPALILPDFIAGAIRQASLGLNLKYREVIENKIITDSQSKF